MVLLQSRLYVKRKVTAVRWQNSKSKEVWQAAGIKIISFIPKKSIRWCRVFVNTARPVPPFRIAAQNLHAIKFSEF